MKKSSLRDATIAVTHYCNARCKMCNIWQIEKPEELNRETFYNLGKDLLYINLSGGEPFIRTDLPEIVKIINEVAPKAKIIISTNGLLSGLIVDTMKKILEIDSRVGVRVSLDGLEDNHDRIRGVGGIYQKAVRTLNDLSELGVKDLGIGFTLMDANPGDVKPLYEWAKENNWQFSISAVQNSNIYFNKKDNTLGPLDEIISSIDYIIKRELESWSVKRWLRAYYFYGLKYYLLTGERLIPSGAAADSVFIDAGGEVYPSNLIDEKIGNINDKNLEELWSSKNIREIREKLQNKKEIEPWTICTVRNNMKKKWIKIGIWILKNKFLSRGLLRR